MPDDYEWLDLADLTRGMVIGPRTESGDPSAVHQINNAYYVGPGRLTGYPQAQVGLTVGSAAVSDDLKFLGTHITTADVEYEVVGFRDGTNEYLEAYSDWSTLVDSQLTLAGALRWGGYSAAQMGPNLSYYAMGDGVYKLDGTNLSIETLSGPAGISTCALIAPQPVENRMAAACFSGTSPAADGSTVHFSGVSDYKTFATSEFVRITPYDGKRINLLLPYRDLLFAMKPDRFAVFYGNSDDAEGDVKFNFEMVDTGIGCIGRYAGCVSPSGVFFLGPDGIYLATGITEPKKISGAIDPVFRGVDDDFILESQRFNPWKANSVRMHWFEDKLYVCLPTGNDAADITGCMYVWDARLDAWYQWSELGSVSALTGARLDSDGGRRALFVSFGPYSSNVHYLDEEEPSQEGSWGGHGQRLNEGKLATVRAVKVSGVGTVDIQFWTEGGFADMQLIESLEVQLGSSHSTKMVQLDPSVRGMIHRVSIEGGNSGAWEVTELLGFVARGDRDNA